MLSRINVGQYIPSESSLHLLDPRTKIIATLVILALIVVAAYPYKLLILGLFICSLMLISYIPLHIYIYALRPFLLIIIITAALQLIMLKGDILVTILGVNITSYGINMAIAISLRLVMIIILIRILMATTTPSSLMGGLEKLLKPFSSIGLPVEELIMIMTISLRFIPLFIEEATRLQQAQISRGINFKSLTIIQRIKSISTLLIPLFRMSFTRALDISTAMETRCYNGGEGRTYLYVFKWGKADYFSLLGLLIITILILL
ncbi:MAG TPA: energy-coupling factor transporter transmembrane component T [Syntrophomonadaceae bacterium]|nr:energy-coupling factor transporter transmembrane component T [Syntrophomonadaceae bacterium]